MSNKFIALEDAAKQLGISKERINELREANTLRAYRDGASWKFRTEEIDKMASEGGPDSAGEAEDDNPFGLSDEPMAISADDELSLDLADDDALSLEDDVLDIESIADDDGAESILLTESELEGELPRPPSTIIGKSDFSFEDDDLSLKSDIDLSPVDETPAKETKPAAPSGAFDDLEELELDLDAESSRLLDASDIAAAQAAAAKSVENESDKPAPVTDEFELDLEESDDSLLAGSDIPASAGGSIAGLSGLDVIDLDDDEQDDLVLGDDSDDLSLSTSDSGINLAPSDSGIALDEVPLDLGGSAIGSALDLASLSASIQEKAVPPAAGSDDNFLLTPVTGEESEESSSDSITFEGIDDAGGSDDPISFEPDASFEAAGSGMDLGFSAEDGGLDAGLGGGLDDGGLGGDLGGGIAAPAGAPAAVATIDDTAFPTWIIALLCCSLLTMSMCGLMALDLIQSMWAWDEPFEINSTIMDQILSIMGK